MTGVGSRVGAMGRALTSHQYDLGLIPARCHTCMWVEFVIGSCLALRVFVQEQYSGFPLSTKTNIYKIL